MTYYESKSDRGIRARRRAGRAQEEGAHLGDRAVPQGRAEARKPRREHGLPGAHPSRREPRVLGREVHARGGPAVASGDREAPEVYCTNFSSAR